MDLSVEVQWILFQICDDINLALKRQKVDEYFDKLIDLDMTE